MTREDLDALRLVARDAWLDLGGCPECHGLGDLFGCSISTCTPEARARTGIDPSLHALPRPSRYLFVDRLTYPPPTELPSVSTIHAQISEVGDEGHGALRQLVYWIGGHYRW